MTATRSPRRSRDGASKAVSRRAKQIVVELSGDAALTIHLKMTGQLFVVPAGAAEDPYIRLVLELADGRELRFRDIRKFGKIGLYGRDPVTGELVTEVGGAALFAQIGPEPLDPAFTLRDFRRRHPTPLRPAQAAPPRPVVHRGRRQHLRRRGAVAVAAPSAPHGRDPPAGRTSGTCSRPSARSWPRRSSAAAPRSTTTRRPTATARCRSTSTSTSGPASRARAAAGRSSASSSGRGAPTSARGASGCRRADRAGARAILRGMTGGVRRTGPRWSDLTGADEAGRGHAARRPATASGRIRAGTAVRAGARDGREPLMSIVRLNAVTREVGTFVILDAIDAAIALGDRIGLVGPNGAGKTTLLRLVAGRDEPDRGEVSRKRGLTHRAARAGGPSRRGLHGLAGPADARSAPAPRTSTGWPRRWPPSSATAGPASTPTPTSSTSTTSSAGTRSTCASTPR